MTGERLDIDLPDVRWREVEIELLEGERELMADLTAAMLAAGIAPAGSSSKVGRVLQGPASAGAPGDQAGRKLPASEVLDTQLRRAAHAVLTADPLLRLDRPAAPERMSAAVRRLRAGLTLRRQVAPEDLTETVRSELAWLDTVVTSLVNVGDAHQRIRAALAVEPKELLLGPVSRRTDRDLGAARKTALASVRATLDSERYLELMQKVQQLAVASPLPPVSGRAKDVLSAPADRAVRRAQRRLGELRRAQSDGERRWQLVGARRAVERARYAEALVPDAVPRHRRGAVGRHRRRPCRDGARAAHPDRPARLGRAGPGRGGERLHLRSPAWRRGPACRTAGSRLNALRKALKRARQP